MLEASLLPRKLSSHFFVFYLENVMLSVRTFVIQLYFGFRSNPDPECFANPGPLRQRVPNLTGSGSTTPLLMMYLPCKASE